MSSLNIFNIRKTSNSYTVNKITSPSSTIIPSSILLSLKTKSTSSLTTASSSSSSTSSISPSPSPSPSPSSTISTSTLSITNPNVIMMIKTNNNDDYDNSKLSTIIKTDTNNNNNNNNNTSVIKNLKILNPNIDFKNKRQSSLSSTISSSSMTTNTSNTTNTSQPSSSSTSSTLSTSFKFDDFHNQKQINNNEKLNEQQIIMEQKQLEQTNPIKQIKPQQQHNEQEEQSSSKLNKAFIPDNDNDNDDKIYLNENIYLKKTKSISLSPTITTKIKNDNCFLNLYVNNKRCLIMYNNEYLSFEPELTTTTTTSTTATGNNIDRVTINISDMIAVWICTCFKQNQNKKQSSIPSSLLCKCIENESTTSSTTDRIINIEKKPEPFLIRIYYVMYNIPKNYNNINYNDKYCGYNLELLTISTHDNKQKRNGINNNNNDDDIAINNETKLLTEIAYSIRTKLELLNRPKNLLIFINPFGGNKNGINIYEKKIKPILNIGRINTNVIITEHADEAKEIILCNKTELNNYDGIICIGGDGMFGEILNGILIRTQIENNIDYDNIDQKLKKPKIKLGIIPAGSTDAVVYATCGYKNPINSILSIILGTTINVDVGAVHNRNDERLIRYTASFMGYGFFGDTIFESENLRWMGIKRYDWAGIKNFLKHRLYSGEIKICLEPNDGSPKDYNPCGINCSICRQAGNKSLGTTLNNDDSPACISIRGRFLAINSALISGRCRMSKYGMSPMAHIGNGCADLILVSKCSRLQYLKYLFSVAFYNKNPFEYDFIDSYRVREFEFNPIVEPTSHKRKGYMVEKSVDCDFFDTINDYYNDDDDDNEEKQDKNLNKFDEINNNNNNRKYKSKKLQSSVWNCDGEIVNDSAIHVKIHCQLIELYATGFNVGQLLANCNIVCQQ